MIEITVKSGGEIAGLTLSAVGSDLFYPGMTEEQRVAAVIESLRANWRHRARSRALTPHLAAWMLANVRESQ